MKLFHMYFFSPECGGSWLKTSVYAKTVSMARKMVANLYYVPERMVFEQ